MSGAGGRFAGRWTFRDFALQLAVVILGVVVTFVGSGLINRWQESRRVKVMMQLVYEELRTNRTQLEAICNLLDRDRRAMALLAEHDMDYRTIPVDSLKKYQFVLGNLSNFKSQNDALEVLRSSGLVTAVADKQLLFEILGCYSWMERFSDAIDTYNAQKVTSLNHLFSGGCDFRGSDAVDNWRMILNDPMCVAFFGAMNNYFGRELLLGGAVGKVDAVMEMLKDKYRFE